MQTEKIISFFVDVTSQDSIRCCTNINNLWIWLSIKRLLGELIKQIWVSKCYVFLISLIFCDHYYFVIKKWFHFDYSKMTLFQLRFYMHDYLFLNIKIFCPITSLSLDTMLLCCKAIRCLSLSKLRTLNNTKFSCHCVEKFKQWIRAIRQVDIKSEKLISKLRGFLSYFKKVNWP